MCPVYVSPNRRETTYRERCGRTSRHEWHGTGTTRYTVCAICGGASRCPPRPTSADHTIHSSANLVHKATPTGSTAQPHGYHPPEASRAYGPP